MARTFADQLPGQSPKQVLFRRSACVSAKGSSNSEKVECQLRTSCVGSVVSFVALRMRSSELPCVELEHGPSSPKTTLPRVFAQMKRAAREKKFERISERLAPSPKGRRVPSPVDREYRAQ